VAPKRKRGRPRKNTSSEQVPLSTTAPVAQPKAKPRGRGRPRKNPVVAEASVVTFAPKPKPKPKSRAKEPTRKRTAEPISVPDHLKIPTDLPTLLVDNGGWMIKYGLVFPKHTGGKNSTSVPTDSNRMSSMYNATVRPPHQLAVLAGDEITSMKNLGQLSWNHPMERGMVTDGETQLRVWARALELLGVVPTPMMNVGVAGSGRGGTSFLATLAASRRARPKEAAAPPPKAHSSGNCAFVLLEQPFVPSVISEGIDNVLFRELGVGRVAKVLSPCMAAIKYLSQSHEGVPDTWLNDETQCCLVIDSGYSATHVVPTQNGGQPVSSAIRRLNIGGKVLTNILKECVTYRQWNMMDEFHIVNDAKEQLCFVNDRFDEEISKASKTRKGMRRYDREYVLPDFASTFRGSVRLPEPLKRKHEAEEMKKIEDEMDALNEEQERAEVAEEAQQLVDDSEEAAANENAGNGSEKRPEPEPKKGKKRKRKSGKKKSVADDDDDNDAEENDSDEETDHQRLKRLKAEREAERRRREREAAEQQSLALSVERFAVPEVLFRPSDIGLGAGGVAEAVAESVAACDPHLRAAMYHNILLVGGNAKMPGYKERVEQEVRSLAPAGYDVRVFLPEEPIEYAWEGARICSNQPGFQERHSVDRATWDLMKKAGRDQHDIWSDKMQPRLHIPSAVSEPVEERKAKELPPEPARVVSQPTKSMPGNTEEVGSVTTPPERSLP